MPRIRARTASPEGLVMSLMHCEKPPCSTACITMPVMMEKTEHIKRTVFAS
jgi:Fe-S-cluster-containing hydrogenase component 2